ncbi:penicillin acylase family protein [Micrococcus sp. TA1]|uniref:penicillin acylase family protein n=1 Tax=Micrococcus sp. TA1 TaxID=681627 RepID=UPI001614A80C|nr:penicillin acylase family protein [Micrococcus sp. TA1]MBB5750046.1 penicillin amidase [Micrococcus sp. TA1]
MNNVKRTAGVALTLTLSLAALAPAAATTGTGAGTTAAPVASAATAGEVQHPSEDVTIKRDQYGVPHVYADTTFDLFYGYGYVVAQDRLFQMEMARRAVLGTSAEVLGPDYVEIDRRTRATFDPAAIRAQLEDLPKEHMDVLAGYAEGMNRHLRQVEADPGTLLPKQFSDHGFTPQEWTAYDVAMIWIGTMANRFSDSTGEVANLQTLQSLIDEHGEEKGRELFDQILWTEDPTAPTTQPRKDTRAPKHLPSGQAREAAAPVSATASGLSPIDTNLSDDGVERMRANGGGSAPGDRPEASNLWITGEKKTRGGGSTLVNGPQFGWFNPSYVYGIGLHGAGYDVTGNTPFAYPAVIFGTNKKTSWGATAGPLDVNDVYQEQLNPKDPTQYRYQGQWRQMEQRQETIEVKDGEPVTHTVYSTVHGTVTSIDTENNSAYAKKRSWTGTEVQSLMAWVDVTKAHDWDDFLDEAQKMGISINWYYADRRGNIGYVSPGRMPKRPEGQDARVPATGDGSMEWEGIRDFSENPQTYNPKQGYIANWNNQAGPGAVGDSGNWSPVDRVQEIIAELESQRRFTPEESWDIIETTSFADLNIRYLRPSLEKAAKTYHPRSQERELIDLVLDWDGQARDDDGDGLYDDPQPAIMRAWLPRLFEEVLADDLPEDVYRQYAQNIYPEAGVARPANGTKLVYNALLGRKAGVEQHVDLFDGEHGPSVLAATYLEAIDQLEAEHGSDPADWEAPMAQHTFSHQNFIGVDQAGEDERFTALNYMNRGTENNMVHLDGRDAEMCTVAPPGQSGFIAPDGTRDEHYSDQLEMYGDFECKDEHLTRRSVDRAAESTTVLTEDGEVIESAR